MIEFINFNYLGIKPAFDPGLEFYVAVTNYDDSLYFFKL